MLSNSTKLVANTKVIKAKECEMAKVNFIIKMEGSIKDNGKIIKWMDTGNYIMREEKLHMRVIGSKISLTEWVKSITIILYLCRRVSITLISIISKTIGSTIKECLTMIQKKAEERSNLPINRCFKETSKMIKFMVLENFMLWIKS